MDMMPEYLNIGRDQLGAGQPVRLQVIGDVADVARHMAQAMLDEILLAQARQRTATIIAPVGPVDQYPLLAEMINQQEIDCRDVMIINMDEYLTDDDRRLDPAHPLSFVGYMHRKFYALLQPQLAPEPEHRLFPDPQDPSAVERAITRRGGVDVCFGGIGINGHIAFNEPPEPGVEMDVETFASLPTRCLQLSPETRTINCNTVGGELSIIPNRCVTVGMREMLAAKRVRFYCNRPWQSAVVRRVLHGPITPACPASLLRNHPDASLTIADYVAEPPDIRLR